MLDENERFIIQKAHDTFIEDLRIAQEELKDKEHNLKSIENDYMDLSQEVAAALERVNNLKEMITGTENMLYRYKCMEYSNTAVCNVSNSNDLIFDYTVRQIYNGK